MSLTSGLDVARSSLGAISEQISIVSRNVSRVGDPDATRKSAQVITDMGATVRVARIDRSFEAGLLDKYLSSNATSQTHTALANALDKLQQTIGDTDVLTSPSALIGKLNAALQEYSSSPSNPSFAAAVVSTAKDLANSLNTASQTVASVRREADADIAAAVGNVNTLLAQVAIVNKEIVNGTRAGVDVTDALDKRDGLLKALSGEIGIRVVSRDDNDIAIYTESGVTMFDVVPRSVAFAPTISSPAARPARLSMSMVCRFLACRR